MRSALPSCSRTWAPGTRRRGRSSSPPRRARRSVGRNPILCTGHCRRTALQPERIGRPGADPAEHALRLEVGVERLDAEFAAEAGLLVAAEGDAREAAVGHVDADLARLQ